MVAACWMPKLLGRTGRTRHRQTWRGKLVLQVEDQWVLTRSIVEKGRRYTRWRDATWEDLQPVALTAIEQNRGETT